MFVLMVAGSVYLGVDSWDWRRWRINYLQMKKNISVFGFRPNASGGKYFNERAVSTKTKTC